MGTRWLVRDERRIDVIIVDAGDVRYSLLFRIYPFKLVSFYAKVLCNTLMSLWKTKFT